MHDNIFYLLQILKTIKFLYLQIVHLFFVSIKVPLAIIHPMQNSCICFKLFQCGPIYFNLHAAI